MRKPKRKPFSVTPAVLPKRPEQNHTRFVSEGNFVSTLDAVALDISTSARQDNKYAFPELEGDIYRTLRQYGLILARYQIADKRAFARRYKQNPKTVDTAGRIVSNYLFKHYYDSDPSDGTVHLAPLQMALGQPEPSQDAVVAAQCYIGTSAFDDLCNPKVIKCPDTLEALRWTHNEINELLTMSVVSAREGEPASIGYHLKALIVKINSPSTYARKDAKELYDWICDRLVQGQKRAEHNKNKRRNEQQNKEREQERKRQDLERLKNNPAKGKPYESKEMTGWANAVISKPELIISHTGLIGRRIRASKEGKYVRDLGRIISDPEQRIFGRKTKALGGVVIVDCSGSMSLTEDEMRNIMKSSSGCSVVAYSDGDGTSSDTPNIWLVARRGRQVRTLPIFPGGNGVDGPALEFGLSFRTHNAPVVWISDTQVTGARGSHSGMLRDQCLAFCFRHNIHIAEDCEQAITLLQKLQRGQKVINQHKHYERTKRNER